jgi:hypothetical protein
MEADGTVYKTISCNMKERILTGWTFTRVLYVALGSFVIIQSAMANQWPGIIFGGYFASMGLFAFGCAAGNCFGGNCTVEPEQKSKTTIQEIEFEELKSK